MFITTLWLEVKTQMSTILWSILFQTLISNMYNLKWFNKMGIESCIKPFFTEKLQDKWPHNQNTHTFSKLWDNNHLFNHTMTLRFTHKELDQLQQHLHRIKIILLITLKTWVKFTILLILIIMMARMVQLTLRAMEIMEYLTLVQEMQVKKLSHHVQRRLSGNGY